MQAHDRERYSRIDPAGALGNALELKCELASLSAKSFDLNARARDLSLEAACFAIDSGEALFRLRQLVAESRG